MIQTELLRAAGVDVRDIDRLEEAWEAYQRAVAQPARQVPHIVCTGIYNAGKSTLLNALCGEEKFPTGDIPTTKEIAQAEFGGAVYVDTPGLNAEDEDDRETLATYDAADFILFVASAQNGGVSEAEAGWLKRLEERYTAGSLKRRLVYVLTHCGQVEPEQVTAIRDRTAADLEEIIGFAPEPIFSVDSVIYQKGISENKPILVEDSVLPQLQAHLTELIAGAGETLRQAQADEIEARRRTLLEQINCCKDFCEKRKADISLQSQRDNVEALFTEAEKKIEAECKRSAYVDSVSVYVSYGTTRIKRMGVTSPLSVEADAKKALNSYYMKCMSEAKSKLKSCMSNIQRDYGKTGMDGPYFKSCNSVNGILEELLLGLRKLGLSLDKASEIRMEPDSNDISYMLQQIQKRCSELEFYDGNGIFNTCYDVFGNRFRTDNIEEGHYKKTLFGEKWVTDVGTEIEMFSAMNDASQQVNEQATWFRESAAEYINDVLHPFLKSLKSEADKRLQEMRKAALDSIDSTQSTAEKPLRYALKHLSKLKEEVSR